MSYLKYSPTTILIVLSLFATVTYSSCQGKCGDVICQNGGVCEKGECDCPYGYEGSLCETMTDLCMNGGKLKNNVCECEIGFEGKYCEAYTRNKFLREWTSGFGGYYTHISPGASVPSVVISNMAHTFFVHSVEAYVEGNTITIPNQIPDNNNRSIEGTGTFDATTNKIHWSFTLYAAPDTVMERVETWVPA